MDQHIQTLRGDVASHLQDAMPRPRSRPDRVVHCGVNISSGRKAPASAASSNQPLDLEHIENRTGDGPQLAAAGDSTIVHVRGMEGLERWPLYVKTAVTGGFRSGRVNACYQRP